MRSRVRGSVRLVATALVLLAVAQEVTAADAAWRADVACGRVLEAPRASRKPGCTEAACVVADGDEACVCKDAGSGALRIALTRRGREMAAWPVDPMLGETTAFRVVLADLDRDGHDDLVISVLDVVSNGMAVQSWTTCVLDGRDPSRARACVPANDVPFLSMPTRPPRGGKRDCRLLAARWRWGSEPRRGDGLYLVGTWLAYRDGALQPDPRRPTVARRYLYRFAAERGDALDTGRTAPIRWWQDATTRALRCPADPLCGEGSEAP